MLKCSKALVFRKGSNCKSNVIARTVEVELEALSQDGEGVECLAWARSWVQIPACSPGES